MEPVGEAEGYLAGEKYLVFKKSRFFEMMGFLALPPWRDPATGEMIGQAMDSAGLAQDVLREVETHRVPDAVVIRRQDLFAGPALDAYSSMIALVAKTTDPDLKESLTKVADYFQDQARLAHEEGFKFPD